MPGRKKEYTEPRTLQYRFLRILKSLGIPSFNFHMLRHILPQTAFPMDLT